MYILFHLNVFYLLMDVKNTSSIQNNFDKLNKLGINFDILIDDSTHSFYDQIRIIKNSTKYMNTGGILVTGYENTSIFHRVIFI